MNNQDEQQGSFLTGFSLGLFAGAIGFFLFASDDGKKYRQLINQEWEQAKDKLAEKGLIKSKNISLRSLVAHFLPQIESTSKKNKPLAKAKALPAQRKSTSTKTKLKFKGV